MIRTLCCQTMYVLLGLCVLACTSTTPRQPDSEQADRAEPATLPRVLVIGDSISQGYHKTVVRSLENKAIVTRIPQNGEWTGTGVAKLDAWLGDTEWDVIHFNFGLWDMYGWPYYDQDRSPQAYAKRLETIVARLKRTDATLIWATTTPACPENEVSMRDRFKAPGIVTPEVEQQYLDAAARVMKKHKVQINDLHALIKPDLEAYAVGPDNVHFNAAGSELLGRQVAEQIRRALDQNAEAAAEDAS